MSWFVSDIRTPNSAVSICLYISNIKYISSDLQLGKLKENFLATQAFANPENISEPQKYLLGAWGSEIFSGLYLILEIFLSKIARRTLS